MKKIIKINVLPVLGFLFLRFLRLFISIKTIGGQHPKLFWDKGENIIMAFWHGRQLMIPFSYKGKSGPHILISLHSDGEIISRAMSYFGFHTIRGSTTKGGTGALKKLISTGLAGGDLVITPDGPKGPRQKMQMGTIILAKKTGLPILPISFGATRTKIFGSWDRFLVPYPFSRGVFVWGDPIFVEDKKDVAYYESMLNKVEQELNKVTQLSDDYHKRNCVSCGDNNIMPTNGL